jgi:RimJ/RimL family protein N-acetyltransferase
LRIIHVRPDEADLGLVALFVDGGAAEMGVMLLRQAHRRGIATEAMAAVRDRAFLQEGLQRLWIRQQASNRAVNPMMERLEFRPLPLDPALPHELRWALDRDDWIERSQATAVAPPRA